MKRDIATQLMTVKPGWFLYLTLAMYIPATIYCIITRDIMVVPALVLSAKYIKDACVQIVVYDDRVVLKHVLGTKKELLINDAFFLYESCGSAFEYSNVLVLNGIEYFTVVNEKFKNFDEFVIFLNNKHCLMSRDAYTISKILLNGPRREK